jgi:hypothetical protein
MGSIVGVMVGIFLLFLLGLLALAIPIAGVALLALSVGLLYRAGRGSRGEPSGESAAGARPAAGRRRNLILGGLVALALSALCLVPVVLLAIRVGPRIESYLRAQ